MSRTWNLVDVTEIAEGAPYTYYIPSNTILEKLKKDDIVKLTFACDVENDKGWSAERMWVIITEIAGDNLLGCLDNNPYYIPDIKAGDKIEFEFCNILQTSLDDTEPNVVDKYISRCYVTNSVLQENNPVLQLFREEPAESEENYSGWNFFSGQEDEEYLNQSENWSFVSIGKVLNVDDSFIEILGSEYGTEFVKNSETGKYEKL